MSHLPECPRIEYIVSRHGYTLTAGSNGCICNRLRACEQRVRGRAITDVIALLEQSTIIAAALGKQGWQRLRSDLIEYRKTGFND